MSTRRRVRPHDFGEHVHVRASRQNIAYDAVWTCRRCGYVLRRPYKTFRAPTTRPNDYVFWKRRDCDTELAKRIMQD